MARNTLKKKAVYWIEDLDNGQVIGPVMNRKDAVAYSDFLEITESRFVYIIIKTFASIDSKVKDSFDDYVKWEKKNIKHSEPFGFGYKEKLKDLSETLDTEQNKLLLKMVDLHNEYGGY